MGDEKKHRQVLVRAAMAAKGCPFGCTLSCGRPAPFTCVLRKNSLNLGDLFSDLLVVNLFLNVQKRLNRLMTIDSFFCFI